MRRFTSSLATFTRRPGIGLRRSESSSSPASAAEEEGRRGPSQMLALGGDPAASDVPCGPSLRQGLSETAAIAADATKGALTPRRSRARNMCG